VDYGEEEGTASQAVEEEAAEGDGDYCVSLAEGGREQRQDGQDGEQGAARSDGQGMSAAEHNQRAGMWAQPHCVPATDTGFNTECATSFNRSWLDMDRVDPCQPTQSHNLGASTQGVGNVHWSAAHIGRAQPIRIDVDEYVEHGQCNVDVGLTLQGQFY
jgi:hypothetical protein